MNRRSSSFTQTFHYYQHQCERAEDYPSSDLEDDYVLDTDDDQDITDYFDNLEQGEWEQVRSEVLRDLSDPLGHLEILDEDGSDENEDDHNGWSSASEDDQDDGQNQEFYDYDNLGEGEEYVTADESDEDEHLLEEDDGEYELVEKYNSVHED